MQTCLVLDGQQRSALAVTRSLGKKGIKVVNADVDKQTLAGCSKFSYAQETYAHQDLPNEFIADLNKIIDKYGVDTVIATTEVSLYTLLEHKQKLRTVTLPYGDLEVIKTLSDKSQLVELCSLVGLRAPRSINFNNAEDFRAQFSPSKWDFPLIVKPSFSKVQDGEGWLSSAVVKVSTEQELLAHIERGRYFNTHPFMIQEFIDGYGSGVFLLYDQGQYISSFAHKRVREKPPEGGVSVLSESVEVDKSLLKASQRLLSHVGWHGVAMIEFKVSHDGVPYVMEVNPRFWGSLQLAIESGVDFPALLLGYGRQDLNNHQGFEKGVQLRWLLGDLDRLYIVLKTRHYSAAKKMRECFKFLFDWRKKRHHEVNRWGDLKPFMFELKRYISSLKS